MKKFFEKHDLIKIAGIMVLLTVLLTWAIPQGYFNNGKLELNEITRVGLFDFFTYGLLGMYYFTVLVTFLFVLGGFYQFLSKLPAYQKLTDSIAKKFEGKEILVSLIISFVIAAFASILNEYYVLIAFIPFIVTILLKANFDKISAFAITFGSIMIGVIGSTISTKIVGINVQYLKTTYTKGLSDRIILFVITYILFNVFNILYLKAHKHNKKSKSKDEEISKDIFECEIKDAKTANVLPIVIVGCLFLVVALLAYIPWTDVFKVSWFTNAYNWINKVELFDCPLLSCILGKITEFGTWDLFGLQALMLIDILILQICYKKGFDSVVDSFGEGFSKIGKVVVVLLLTYVVLEFAVMYPVIPTIIDKILGAKFNVFTTAISGIITSLFTAEYQYSINLVYSYFTTAYSSSINVIAFILQSTYGLVAFFAPTSAVLLVGLSYLDIPYKNWIKYIWKFLIAMLIVIIVMALIIA